MTKKPPVPTRAHSILLKAEGDSAKDLARELRHLAERLTRGDLSVGCTGAPDGGCIYSYTRDPSMTHDAYFQAIAAWLGAQEPTP